MSETHLEKAPHAAGHSALHDASTRIDNLKFAMWLYLASEVVIFSVLIATYLVFRVQNPDVVKRVHEDADILLVSFNTFVLLASSWAMVMGLRQIQMNNRRGLVRWIGLTAVLGTVFVLGQVIEYQHLAQSGIAIFNQGNEFDGFGARFYAPTAFHGLHVVVGVLWALYVIRNGLKGRYGARNYVGVEAFGLYWHFVDVVWIVLFTMIYLV